ncbi:MAG: cadherin repeat domain-containing protein, partial [Nanoarchaeota archaeon]|nr:cadherin repeat domain-containing protein [Nanoarchaeota archaeon]
MKRIGIIATIITIMLLSVAFVSANEAPVLTVSSCASKAVEDESYTCTVTATDADAGDVLTYSLTAPDADGMTINPTTGVITWTPNDEQIGSHDITVKVEDDETPTKASDQKQFTIFARPEGVCGDYESGTDIKITDLEITDDDEDFYPGSEIEITVDVE